MSILNSVRTGIAVSFSSHLGKYKDWKQKQKHEFGCKNRARAIYVLTGMSFLVKSSDVNLRTIGIRKWFRRNICLPFCLCCSTATAFLFQCHERMKCAHFLLQFIQRLSGYAIQFSTVRYYLRQLISIWTVELLDSKQFFRVFNHAFNHSSHIHRIFLSFRNVVRIAILFRGILSNHWWFV